MMETPRLATLKHTPHMTCDFDGSNGYDQELMPPG